MQTFAEISEAREFIQQARRDGRRIGFVPTMGNLHDGHLTLVKKAQELADIVVVSIFVNPLQFDRADDLDNYPRTLEADLNKLTEAGVDAVFAPQVETMYPEQPESHTLVDVPVLSTILEGNARPGHFRGVTTVVTKLLNIIQPDLACFGEKDFQQLAIVRKLVSDLALNVEIVGVPTTRELDGLAMSSRNNLLTIDERQRAPVLARTMRWMSSAIRGGRRDYDSIIEDANDQLRAADLEPDQIFIRDARTLQDIDNNTQQIVILMSAFLGQVRLIDNLVVDITQEPREEQGSGQEPESTTASQA